MVRRLVVVLAVIATSCVGAESTETTASAVAGPSSAEAAVSELLAALASGDFDRAADLTLEDEIVAIAAAENASLGELTAVVEDGGRSVAANYWEGFAMNLVELTGTPLQGAEVLSAEQFAVGDVNFARVSIDLPGDDVSRQIVARQVVDGEPNGWKIDVVATFATTLGPRLGRLAEAIRSDPSATEVMTGISRLRIALEAALTDPRLDSETSQLIRAAILSMGG
jgi:hypothetical protein